MGHGLCERNEGQACALDRLFGGEKKKSLYFTPTEVAFMCNYLVLRGATTLICFTLKPSQQINRRKPCPFLAGFYCESVGFKQPININVSEWCSDCDDVLMEKKGAASLTFWGILFTNIDIS